MTGAPTMRLTILGSGSSSGVPRIGNDWGQCDPNEPRNRRLRGSLLVQRWTGAPGAAQDATTLLIDTSPDLRAQLLGARVSRLDAVLYTHDHADQAHGIDDLRTIALMMRRRVPVHMDEVTASSLTQRFGYCFKGAGGYPAILDDADRLRPGAPLTITGPGGPITALPLDQDHGGVRSLGFRFGRAGYSNDVVALPPETMARLAGLELWIVDALRRHPHPSHAHLARTLDWIAMLAPRRAVLTNLHIDMDYQTLREELPAGVEPGFDGWTAELEAP
jgi:phosphoribosyl 1,2-cyclic phosphate phosphodiesterase